MTPFVVAFIVLLGAVGAVAVSAFRSGDSTKFRHIMGDLGLLENWSSEDGSQFYKWGWHEEQENRVSAERIVKGAFQKAGVWIDRQDLSFFKNQCKKQESNEEVNVKLIVDKIHGVIKRAERVRRWVADEVHTVVQFVQNVNPSEAQAVLSESRIESDPDTAHERLIILEMQRMMYRHGSQILALGAKGLIVQDPVSAQTFHLEGMDSWRHLIRMFKEEILDVANGRKNPIDPALARTLRSTVEIGFFHKMEADIERQRGFLRKIHDQFHNKEINVSYERAKVIDAILYRWKFNEGTQFNQNHHNKIRDILSRLDLAPRFREILFERLDEHFSSLHQLIRLFPVFVIFHSGSGSARSFAADQYSRHFLSLLEAFAAPSGRDMQPPTIIWINEEQVEKMRQGPKRGSNAITITQLISDQQRISRLEQGISEKIANARGWIVNFSADYLTEKEFEELNKDPLKEFVRFPCEAGEEVDFINNTYNAKKSRIQFFNLVIDSLVEIPAIVEAGESNTPEEKEPEVKSPPKKIPKKAPPKDPIDDADFDSVPQSANTAS